MDHNKKNLVIVRAGDESLHSQWLGESKEFDLFISYYGSSPDKFASDGEFYEVRGGGKWSSIFSLLEENPQLFDYRNIWLPDDDLQTTVDDINKMFSTFEQYSLTIAQPSLSNDSYVAFPIVVQQLDCVLRYTNFVEIMAPIFLNSVLKAIYKRFAGLKFGWGLDYIWSHEEHQKNFRNVAIIDAVCVKHNRPIGSGPLYQASDVEPKAELSKVLEEYAQNIQINPAEIFRVSKTHLSNIINIEEDPKATQIRLKRKSKYDIMRYHAFKRSGDKLQSKWLLRSWIFSPVSSAHQLLNLPLFHYRKEERLLKSSLSLSNRFKQENGQVIIGVLGGSKKYLQFLMRHLNFYLKNGIIDEVHLWDFAISESDREWMYEISKTSNKIILMTPELEYVHPPFGKRSRKIEFARRPIRSLYWSIRKTITRERWREHFYSFYRYYERNLKDNDILIKCDDDVVYLGHLDRLIDFVNQSNYGIYYPNIVNNDVGAYFQIKTGMVSGNLDYFLEWGVAKGEPLSLWYKNPKMAKWIHAEFLSDPAKFVKDIVCDWSTPQRVSINVFAVKGKDFRNYMGKFKNNYADEPYFSYEISKIFEHKSVMYMNSVVCHYKFGPQQDALEKSELLKRYEDLLP